MQCTLVQIPGFCQAFFFFSRFFADFDAQYGKLGFFWVEVLFMAKNIGLLLAIEPKLTNKIQKYQLFKNNL